MQTTKVSYYANLIENSFKSVNDKTHQIFDRLETINKIVESLPSKPENAYLAYTGCYGAYGCISRNYETGHVLNGNNNTYYVTHFPTDNIKVTNKRHYLYNKEVPVFVPLSQMVAYFGFGLVDTSNDQRVSIDYDQKELLKKVFNTADEISYSSLTDGCRVLPVTCESLLPSWPFGENLPIHKEPEYREFRYKDKRAEMEFSSTIMFITLEIGVDSYSNVLIMTLPIPFYTARRSMKPDGTKYEPSNWKGYNSSMTFAPSILFSHKTNVVQLNTIHDSFNNQYPFALCYDHLSNVASLNSANGIDCNDPYLFVVKYNHLSHKTYIEKGFVNSQETEGMIKSDKVFINLKSLELSSCDFSFNSYQLSKINSKIFTGNRIHFNTSDILNGKSDRDTLLSIVDKLTTGYMDDISTLEFTSVVFSIYSYLCEYSPNNMEIYKKTFIPSSAFFDSNNTVFAKLNRREQKCTIEDLIVFMLQCWTGYRLSKYIRKTNSSKLSKRILSEFNTITTLLGSPKGVLNKISAGNNNDDIIEIIQKFFSFGEGIDEFKDKYKMINAYMEVIELEESYFGDFKPVFYACKSIFTRGIFKTVLEYVSTIEQDIIPLSKHKDHIGGFAENSILDLMSFLSGGKSELGEVGKLPKRKFCFELDKENNCFKYLDIEKIHDKQRFFSYNPYGRKLLSNNIRSVSNGEDIGVSSFFTKVMDSIVGTKFSTVPVAVYDLNNFEENDILRFVENIEVDCSVATGSNWMARIQILPGNEFFSFSNFYIEDDQTTTFKVKNFIHEDSDNLKTMPELFACKIKHLMDTYQLNLGDFKNRDIWKHDYFTPSGVVKFKFMGENNRTFSADELNERNCLLLDFIAKINEAIKRKFNLNLSASKILDVNFIIYFALPVHDKVIGMYGLEVNGRDFINTLFFQNTKSYSEIETLISVLL